MHRVSAWQVKQEEYTAIFSLLHCRRCRPGSAASLSNIMRKEQQQQCYKLDGLTNLPGSAATLSLHKCHACIRKSRAIVILKEGEIKSYERSICLKEQNY